MKNSELVKRIEKIENRNKKVETDKAWETSYTRRRTPYSFHLFKYWYLYVGYRNK